MQYTALPRKGRLKGTVFTALCSNESTLSSSPPTPFYTEHSLSGCSRIDGAEWTRMPCQTSAQSQSKQPHSLSPPFPRINYEAHIVLEERAPLLPQVTVICKTTASDSKLGDCLHPFKLPQDIVKGGLTSSPLPTPTPSIYPPFSAFWEN